MAKVCVDNNCPVDLEPIEHVYYHKETKQTYTSVTQVIGTIENEFESEEVAKAISQQTEDSKNPAYSGMTQDQILDYWQKINDDANEYGTKIHETIENYLLKNKWYFPKDELEEKVINAYDNFDINEGIFLYPERILFSQEYELAGTADFLADIDDEFFELGDWKGLPLDTPIFTNNGWKTMGTLDKKDKVYDKDGNLVKINHISEVKNKPCYKITFDNNEEIVSDYEHRWLISFVREIKPKDFVMTTEEIYEYLNGLENRWSYKIPKIKIAEPLNNKKVELPIDPYVLGIWLGDGHKGDGKVTSMYPEIWNEIENRGYEIGDDVSQGSSGKAQTRTITGLRRLLKENNILNNKHIPDIYYLGSYDQRLSLLRGLMDSDGHYNKSRKRFVMSTTNKIQAEYFLSLLSSLGIKGTFIDYEKNAGGKRISCYDVCFSTKDLNPFLCLNKNTIIYGKQNNRDFKNIVSVEKVESTPTKCIEVNSPTSTFLYGKTFSVTHNTNKRFNYFSPFGDTLKKPFDHLQDCHYSIYSLQLSTYALMYELETGKKCRRIWIGYWDRHTEEIYYIPVIYMRNEANKLLEHHRFINQLGGNI